MDLAKSTKNSVLLWLTFTKTRTVCGRRKVIRRLIEYDPIQKKIIYIWPPEYTRSRPRDSYLAGRKYKRLHEFDPKLLGDQKFIGACKSAGIFERDSILS